MKIKWSRKFVILRSVKISHSDRFGCFENGYSYTDIKDARRAKKFALKVYDKVVIVERKERVVK